MNRDSIPDGSDEDCESKMHQYAFIAETLFKRIPQHASLSLLAFGEEYQYGDLLEKRSVSEDYTRWCFFRHRITDTRIIGITRAIPVQIPIKEAKYIVSESDVLEYRFPYYPRA